MPTRVAGDEEPISVDIVVGTQTGSGEGVKRFGDGDEMMGVDGTDEVLTRAGDTKENSGKGSSEGRTGGPPRMNGRRTGVDTR